MEGKAKTIAIRAKKSLTIVQWLANLTRYWHLHTKPQTSLLHPTHKTEAEKRLKRNKQARKAYAKKKVGK